MTKIKYFMLLFALGAIAISCGDDDGDAPLVNITAPAANSSYAVTDTIPLTGTVTEDTELATILISSDLGINETITAFDSDTSHVLNYSITLDSMTTAGSYSFTVTATDAAGNVGSDDVQISIQ